MDTFKFGKRDVLTALNNNNLVGIGDRRHWKGQKVKKMGSKPRFNRYEKEGGSKEESPFLPVLSNGRQQLRQ